MNAFRSSLFRLSDIGSYLRTKVRKRRRRRKYMQKYLPPLLRARQCKKKVFHTFFFVLYSKNRYLCSGSSLLRGVVGSAGGHVRGSNLMESLGPWAVAKGRFLNVIFESSNFATLLTHRRYRNEASTWAYYIPI